MLNMQIWGFGNDVLKRILLWGRGLTVGNYPLEGSASVNPLRAKFNNSKWNALQNSGFDVWETRGGFYSAICYPTTPGCTNMITGPGAAGGSLGGEWWRGRVVRAAWREDRMEQEYRRGAGVVQSLMPFVCR